MALRRVAARSDLWGGEVLGLCVDGHRLLLVDIDGEVRAYEDRCPHKGARLSEGRLERERLTCAVHEWVFDLRSGAGINPRSATLRTYAVEVRGADILVDLEPPRGLP